MKEKILKTENMVSCTDLKNSQAQIGAFESERFFEKILVGRKFWEAPIITSRICGNCSAIHNITSIKAIESACSINPSLQTQKLRKLMICGQMIYSHSLHLYWEVLPDFVGIGSFFELQKSHPDLFQNAISLIRYAEKILETFGGRTMHLIASVPGGFKSYPKKQSAKILLAESQDALGAAEKTLRLIAFLNYPFLETKRAFITLHKSDEYAFYEGDIWANTGEHFEAKDYSNFIYEELMPQNRAKFGTLMGKKVMVGALARYNQNGAFLGEKIKKLINNLGVPKTLNNPFYNILAEAIECYFFAALSIDLLHSLMAEGIKNEPVIPPAEFTSGIAACEAPQGILLHHYELNKEGFITKCNVITPAVLNLPALELDLKQTASKFKEMPDHERCQTIDLLVKAYDICSPCATH